MGNRSVGAADKVAESSQIQNASGNNPIVRSNDKSNSNSTKPNQVTGGVANSDSAETKEIESSFPSHRLDTKKFEFSFKCMTLKGSSSDLAASSLSTTLADDLRNQVYQCMVCYDEIERSQSTWSCSTCYAVFHLNCIRQWAVKSRAAVNANEPNIATWRCPGCQTSNTVIPATYLCFCGKRVNPALNFGIMSHSCGEVCSRVLPCSHTCTSKCHPGPCTKCNSSTSIRCNCGKDSKALSCKVVNDSNRKYFCGAVCGRTLSCGKHACSKICHDEPCGKCKAVVFSYCFCGKYKRRIHCSPNNVRYSCGESREFKFKCGKHSCVEKCDEIAHKETDPCPFDPSVLKTCPCGKRSLSDLIPETSMRKDGQPVCLNRIATCKELCLKLLRCGHRCFDGCHEGRCSPCPSSAKVPCFCGKEKSLQAKCIDLKYDNNGTVYVDCENVCNMKLECRRHKCAEKCCVKTTTEHFCTNFCAKLLGCKQHTCQKRCSHNGHCSECVVGVKMNPLLCACGRTSRSPPIPCGAGPPECKYPCTRQKFCPLGHSSYSLHQCHDDSVPCPPCTKNTLRTCVCGKEKINIPCSRIGAPTCMNVCAKTRDDCGHMCAMFCHDNSCSVIKCTQTCSRKRSCGHTCLYPCHKTKVCTESEICRFLVEISCPCGNLKTRVLCGLSASNVATPPAIKCNDSCSLALKNEQIASLLGIDLEKEPFGISDEYSDSLILNASRSRPLLIQAEQIFASLVENPSLQYYYFKRQRYRSAEFMLLELAEHYGLFAQMVDRNVGKPTVVVRATKRKVPTMPKVILSEFLKTCPKKTFVLQEPVQKPLDIDLMEEQIRSFRSEPYQTNAILVGEVIVSDEVTPVSLKQVLSVIAKSMHLGLNLTWISESAFVLRFEQTDPPDGNTSDIPEKLLMNIKSALIDELSWSTKISQCQMSPIGVIRLQDNTFVRRLPFTKIQRQHVLGDPSTDEEQNPKNGIQIN